MGRLHRSSHPLRQAAALHLRWLSVAGGGETDLYKQSEAAPQAPAHGHSVWKQEQQQQDAGEHLPQSETI